MQIADGLRWRVDDTNNNVIVCVAKGGTYPGDLNGDRHTQLDDLPLLLTSYGTCDGQAAFDPAADLEGKGCVDFDDLWLLLSTFGLQARRLGARCVCASRAGGNPVVGLASSV